MKSRSENSPFSIKKFLIIRESRTSRKGKGGIIFSNEIINGTSIIRPLFLRSVFDVKKGPPSLFLFNSMQREVANKETLSEVSDDSRVIKLKSRRSA